MHIMGQLGDLGAIVDHGILPLCILRSKGGITKGKRWNCCVKPQD